MDSKALLALAERVEGATAGDRELDALIRCAVFAPPGSIVQQSPINGAWCIYHGEYQGRPRSWEPRGLTHEQRLGSFTESLDAAITLLPEGFIHAVWYPDGGVNVQAWQRIGKGYCGFGVDIPEATAATYPLALTAAALRALATSEPS